jgi:hypothetical protein
MFTFPLSASSAPLRESILHAEAMQLDKSRPRRAKRRQGVVTKFCAAQKTAFLQITIWVI